MRIPSGFFTSVAAATFVQNDSDPKSLQQPQIRKNRPSRTVFTDLSARFQVTRDGFCLSDLWALP